MATSGWVFGDDSCAHVEARDALVLGTGTRVRRVVCGPPTPKCACPVAAVRWGYDATPVLRRYAREVALDVARLWDAPPVVLRYLKTGDESIRDATWAAAVVVASAATSGAAEGAGWAAAEAAAWAANEAAVWAAARAAAAVAAEAAAKVAAMTVVGDAARVAAGAAARDTTKAATEKRQSTRLARLLTSGRLLYGQRAVP